MKKKLKNVQIFYEDNDFNFLQKFIEKNNAINKVIETNTSSRMSGAVYGSGLFFSLNNFKLLNKIKTEIKENKNIHDIVDHYYNKYCQNVNIYCDVHDSGVHEDTYMLDISACYIHTAYIEGIISEKLFLKLKNLPKQKRLVLLGAIATKKRIEVYEDGNLVGVEDVPPDILLKKTWNFIVNKTFENLTFIIKELSSFLFFWVDAFFVKNYNDINILQEYLTNKKYSYKISELDFSYYLTQHTHENHYIRRFVYRKKNSTELKQIYLPSFNL